MISQTQGYGQASGKIILMGEHAVVYGEPAIAFPFKETKVTTTVTKAAVTTIDCVYYQGALAQVPETLKNIQVLVQQTLAAFQQTEAALTLTIQSNIPAERGMGSSAAVAVSVVRALANYYQIDLTTEALLALVRYAENISHGNPSGIDAATTSSFEPIFFVRNQPFETFSMNMTQGYLIVADTGIKGKTREAVQDIASQRNKQPAKTNAHIHALGKLTIAAKHAILKNELCTLGQAMTDAQQHLRALGVSNHVLDELIFVAQNKGALGAKLTGGGRGGCFIALAKSKKEALVIVTALKHAGAKNTWIQALGVNE